MVNVTNTLCQSTSNLFRKNYLPTGVLWSRPLWVTCRFNDKYLPKIAMRNFNSRQRNYLRGNNTNAQVDFLEQKRAVLSEKISIGDLTHLFWSIGTTIKRCKDSLLMVWQRQTGLIHWIIDLSRNCLSLLDMSVIRVDCHYFIYR